METAHPQDAEECFFQRGVASSDDWQAENGREALPSSSVQQRPVWNVRFSPIPQRSLQRLLCLTKPLYNS